MGTVLARQMREPELGLLEPKEIQAGVVITCNPSMQEAETADSQDK